MVGIIVVLIAAGIMLEFLTLAMIWPPWRSRFPSLSWLLVLISGTLVVYDTMILLATLRIPVNPLLALTVLLGKDALFLWRIKVVLRARHAFRTHIAQGKENDGERTADRNSTEGT